jgi:hypothetical protein
MGHGVIMSRMHGSGLAAAVLALLVLPAQAQAGFFDQLFGAQPEPYYGYPPPFSQRNGAPIRHRSHRARAAAVEEKPVRQTPTDLMHDATLRYGDAVMMGSGIAIFTGRRGASHDREDFSPLQEAKHMRPREKTALGSVDVTRLDGVAGVKSSGQLVSGRSSTLTVPVTQGVMINDPNGKTIRYVGP